MANKSKDTISKIEEFELNGYFLMDHNLYCHLKRRSDILVKIFNPKLMNRPKICTYTTIDLFGDNYSYIYNDGRKEEFAKFLEDKFLKKNESPSIGMRRVFTRVLHYHGLHWQGCCTRNPYK